MPFSYSRSIFWEQISWQVLKIRFQSLQIWKSYGGGHPQTPLQGSCMYVAIMPPPRHKKPSYVPGLSMFSMKSRHIANESLVRTQRWHI